MIAQENSLERRKIIYVSYEGPERKKIIYVLYIGLES